MSFLVFNYAFWFILHLACTKQTDIYKEKFRNYSIYEVTAFNTRERAVLYTLHSRVEDIIFLNGITNEAALPMDVLVDNCCTSDFETILHANDIEYVKVKKENVVLESGDLKVHMHHHLNGNEEPNLSDNFHCYGTLRQWVELKTKRNSILEEIKIGQTYEKRDIFVLKISTGERKKSVFIMGGEEGRDWTSPAILLNFVTYILEKRIYLEILTKHYDFYILPLFNPDGYMYSMVKDRVWSKNSRVYIPKKPCADNKSAIGISIDRNWYFNKLTVRNEDCDKIFTGSKPLSEKETYATSTFLNTIALNMMAFINIRGFENLVTIPYGYDKKHCNNFDVLMDILSAVHDSVKKQHNVTFNYGLASKYLYNFSGNVADWVKNQLNTPIVYTFYMKIENYILPNARDVQPLTAQLSTMMREILLLANTFYGPLFNHQIKFSINIYNLLMNIILCFIKIKKICS